MNKLKKLIAEIIAELLKEEPKFRELLVKRKLSYNEPSIEIPKDRVNQEAYSCDEYGDNEEEIEIEESSTTGSVDGYMTPNAFSAHGQDPKKKKAVKAMDWPIVEAAQLSSWEKFLLTLEATSEDNIRDFLFDPLKEPYIDTPGNFYTRKGGRGSIADYMKRNMGSRSYQQLYNFYTKYKIRCDAFVKKFGHIVGINESVDFKDTQLSPKKKIAFAVKSMREQLKEIESVLDKSVNFKEEAGLKTSDFYKRTHNHLRKIGEQVTRIMNKIQAIK